jgi:hypothetical protein
VGLLLATNWVPILVFSNLAIKVKYKFYDTSKLFYDSKRSVERSFDIKEIKLQILYSHNKELALPLNIEFGSATLIQDTY